jgi:hypothetical protein
LLAACWPAAVALAVVATGNNFVLDIVAGALATLAGLAASLCAERLIGWLRRTPDEDRRDALRELPAGAAA